MSFGSVLIRPSVSAKRGISCVEGQRVAFQWPTNRAQMTEFRRTVRTLRPPRKPTPLGRIRDTCRSDADERLNKISAWPIPFILNCDTAGWAPRAAAERFPQALFFRVRERRLSLMKMSHFVPGKVAPVFAAIRRGIFEWKEKSDSRAFSGRHENIAEVVCGYSYPTNIVPNIYQWAFDLLVLFLSGWIQDGQSFKITVSLPLSLRWKRVDPKRATWKRETTQGRSDWGLLPPSTHLDALLLACVKESRWKALVKSPIKHICLWKCARPFITSDSLKQRIRSPPDTLPFNFSPITQVLFYYFSPFFPLSHSPSCTPSLHQIHS